MQDSAPHIEPVPNEVLIIKKLRGIEHMLKNLNFSDIANNDTTDYENVVDNEYNTTVPMEIDEENNDYVETINDTYET